jgi:alanyl-tRNA synthetase
MQSRFYYENAMMKQFTATIEKVTKDEENQTYIVLNNTAFYPTGGGQPHDTGKIDEFEIVNVEEIDGEIRHYVADGTDVSTLVGEVHAEINWQRRFDHMQQHAGQHILTAAFVELFDFPTVSFHLGTDSVTIDLLTTQVTDEQLLAAERLANDIILENRPIETKWVTAEEAAEYPLRKALKVDGPIRLVIIPDFDYNGCGGTHPTSTGQVQAIKILSTEKMKQNIRVHFVCGGRVIHALHTQNAVLTDVAKQLSAKKEEAHHALRKVLTTAKTTEKALNDANDQLLQFEAKEFITSAAEHGSTVIVKAFHERSIQQLQKLAKFMTAQNENLSLALIGEFEDKYQIVTARGNSGTSNMREVMQTVLPLIEGKGGGNDMLAQGGGAKTIDRLSLIDALIEAINLK